MTAPRALPKTRPELSPEHAQARAGNIGGSEVGSLFGWGFETKLELYNRKTAELAGVAPAAVDRPTHSEPRRPGALDPLTRGSVLETAVAELFAIETQLDVYPLVDAYWPHPTIDGMGASPDFELVHPDWGPGILSIKTAIFWIYRRWQALSEALHGAGAAVEPSMGYQLQVQQELACSPGSAVEPGAPHTWGCIATLVGLERLEVFPAPANDLEVIGAYRPNEQLVGQMAVEIDRFWDRVRRAEPPPADFERDWETLAAMQTKLGVGVHLDLRRDEDFNRAGNAYVMHRDEETYSRKLKELAGAELREISVRQETPAAIYGQDFTLKNIQVKGSRCPGCRRPLRKPYIMTRIDKNKVDKNKGA